MDNIYGNRQAARAWHVLDGGTRISSCQQREDNLHEERKDDDFIIHGVFVGNFATIPTSLKLNDEFEARYSADFNHQVQCHSGW
jgi:hypothetical protein